MADARQRALASEVGHMVENIMRSMWSHNAEAFHRILTNSLPIKANEKTSISHDLQQYIEMEQNPEYRQLATIIQAGINTSVKAI